MKISLLLATFLLLSSTIHAQENTVPRVTITAGYGSLTVPQMVESFTDILGTGLSFGTVKYDDETFTGAILVGAKFSTRTKFKFGLDLAYEKFKSNVYNADSGELLGKSNGSYVSVIPRADYYWIDRKSIRLYSGIGAGVSFAEQQYDDDKDNSVFFAFNIAPIGFEVGGLVSFYAETSIGYNGLLNGGVRFRF